MISKHLDLAISTLVKWGATPEQVQKVLSSDSERELKVRVYTILSIRESLKMKAMFP